MNTMAMRGGKRLRPLGSIRNPTPPDDAKMQIPKLSSIPKASEAERLDETYSGIQGNAMALPSLKESPVRLEERRRSLPLSGSHSANVSKTSSMMTSNGTAVSHEACERELKEVLGRERELKDRVSQLLREVEQLTAQGLHKDDVIHKLQQDLQQQKVEHEQRLAEEECNHQATRQELESTQSQLNYSLQQLTDLERRSKEQMELLRTDLTRQLAELEATKNKEIADRDQKLNRLKLQMAEALKGNSWERQQQLEELTKDLARMQEECDALRSKLKSQAKGKTGLCDKCGESTGRAEKLASTLKEKEMKIKELKSLCSRFEKQLNQQDVLLKQWADSKGFKIALPK